MLSHEHTHSLSLYRPDFVGLQFLGQGLLGDSSFSQQRFSVPGPQGPPGPPGICQIYATHSNITTDLMELFRSKRHAFCIIFYLYS